MGEVFEAGQVRRWRATGLTRVLSRIDERGQWHGLDAKGVEVALGAESIISDMMTIVRPAPKPGQRWSSKTHEPARIVGLGDGNIAAMPAGIADACAHAWGTGSIVGGARWLLDNGYEPVENLASAEAALGRGVFTKDEVRAAANSAFCISEPETDDLQNATVISAESGHAGHIWRDGKDYTITWTDVEANLSQSTLSEPTIRAAIADGAWICIEVPAKEQPGAVAAMERRNDYHAFVAKHGREPNISPLRWLADTVAAIYTTPDRETSRRYVDMAVKAIAHEPFSRAVQAVLVNASEHPLGPATIASLIDGCRAWECRRSKVAPGQRALRIEQKFACYASAIAGSGGAWTNRLSNVYERARAT